MCKTVCVINMAQNIVVFHACRKPYANPKFPLPCPLAFLLGLFTGQVGLDLDLTCTRPDWFRSLKN